MARILVGVTGGIAAYKAVELVRLATKAGHALRVVQTDASLEFVGRATFEAVTGAPVLVGEFERDAARGGFPGDPVPDRDPISHLELVARSDAYVVAPASANTIAKLASGLADNLLTSAALAARCPLVLAPAMNDAMWDNPATQANVETLKSRGATVVAPDLGSLASEGEWGVGRLAEPARILAAVESRLDRSFRPRSLDGLRVLVTAGGTREPIDSVRYLGNRSSGRMGFALAAEARRRGAEVTLVAANVALERPEGVRVLDVATAAQMDSAVHAEFPQADVLLMAAAVADFRPLSPESAKIKKAARQGLTIETEPTNDVLAGVSELRRKGQLVIGFAAEHGDGGISSAREKLERKGLDAIVVNDIARAGIGFDTPDNEVSILSRAGRRSVARAAKDVVAAAILDEVEALHRNALELPG